eukprot:3597949-Amphidinium_carterae.2
MGVGTVGLSVTRPSTCIKCVNGWTFKRLKHRWTCSRGTLPTSAIRTKELEVQRLCAAMTVKRATPSQYPGQSLSHV